MSIPKYNELYGALLHSIEDGEVHNYKDMKKYVADYIELSDKDKALMLPSGNQSIFDNRIGWTRTYLKKAGLIESPSRGKHILTDEGKKALSDCNKIDNTYLLKYKSFANFYKHKTKENLQLNEGLKEEQAPAEAIEIALKELDDILADELMMEVMKLSPSDFERLVIKLLLKMGYGGGIEENAVVTSVANDGGIDGIIKEDQLGFSSIYIQAKQWATNRTVERPEIQKFAGALQGQQASKGLFITTARFSSGAKEFVNNLYGSTIVLVDGMQLMKLMIKYNLGVSVENVYEVKRVDSDFFEDDF